MKTSKKPVKNTYRIQRVNLLNPRNEPSDAALVSIMRSVQRTARIKSEQANCALFVQLQRETEAAINRNRIGKIKEPGFSM